MLRRFQYLISIFISASILVACVHLKESPEKTLDSDAKTLQVMTSGGFAAAYEVLRPKFEAETGYKLETLYGSSSGGAVDSIPERLKRGEHTDVVILSQNGFKNLNALGFVDNTTYTPLADSMIGLAVIKGAPKPDITTVEAFAQTMLEAESIGFSASASGTFLSTKLFPRMGIWQDIESKSTRILSERVGSVVARGDVQMGFQQVSELLPIDGIDYVGPIPDELQKITTFVSGVSVYSDNPDAAALLVEFLSSPDNSEIVSATGLFPVP